MSKITKLFRNPVLFFQDVVTNRRVANYMEASGGNDDDGLTFAFHINDWKRPILELWFPEKKFVFVPIKTTVQQLRSNWVPRIRRTARAEVLVWGMNLPLQVKALQKPTTYVEDGFIRSIGLGANHTPPLSLNFDSKTLYFNANEESDLEALLNKYDFAADPALMERAQSAIELLMNTGISKYNSAGPVDINQLYGKKNGRRVLVIGQVEDDASIKFGCNKPFSNNDLVRLAVKENPDAQVIYKPHPDVLDGRRAKRSDPSEVADICQVLTQPMPMAQAFETIDHVYTITSLAGFEALLRGIKVTAVGAPFYAGWGLTDDRQPTPRRVRRLTLNQLFAAAYLLYPRYADPETGVKRTFEATVLKLQSDLKELASKESVAATPVSSGVIVEEAELMYEPYADGISTYLVGDVNYRALLSSWFDDRRFEHIPAKTTNEEFAAKFKKRLDKDGQAEFFVIADDCAPDIRRYLQTSRKKVTYLSEGFIRSVELEARKTPPYSLLLDSRAPCYDARRPTDLEELLSSYAFEADPALLERADRLLEQVLQSGLSKYNHVARLPDVQDVYGVKDRPRVLVLGQVEDADSVKLANPRRYSNNDVVTIAAKENPGAQIIFKPHPDVLNKHKTTASDPLKVKHLCQVLEQDLPLAQALETVDHVYSISSLGGFEALLRGIRTTTLGLPFYAGWGLGDDRQRLERRQRKLSVREVFAAAYVLYPVYVDAMYKMPVSAEQAVERLNENVSLALTQETVVASADIELQEPQRLIPTYLLGDVNYRPLLSSWFDDRKFTHVPAKTTSEEFGAKFKKGIDSTKDAEFFVVGDDCAPYLKRYMDASGKKVTHLSEGFIRSVELEAKKTPPYSLLLDSRAPYYDAQRPTDLEELLSSYAFEADPALLERADRLLEQVLQNGLSKFNHVARLPDVQDVYGVKDRPRVLVLGQVEGAASVKLANPRGYSNNDVVTIAAMENPGAQIIFKPHPDVLNKHKTTASDPLKVKHLCEVLEQDLPLAQALETVDHVYSISSLGGFEALLRGIRTTTLGLPFYAGWGLGDDRQTLERRQRKLSVREVFAAAYVLYPTYVDPLYRNRISPLDVVSRIKQESSREGVNNSRLYLNDEILLPKDPSGKKTAFLLVFHPWKRDFFEKVFSSYKVHFLPSNISASKLEEILLYVEDSELIIWGYKETEEIANLIKKRKIKVRRVEDGFVRSLALGAEHALPASIAVDGAHLYFDATGQSDLEKILSEYDFKSNPDLLAEAKECMSLIQLNRVSKYNHVEAKTSSEIFGEKKRKRILVVGQVEDDASIRFGCNRQFLNNDLVITARLENPDADVFYKPHPDVLGGHREHRSDPALVECYAKVIYEPLALADALVDVDHVYTITSLAGFEALLRGIKVTTIGSPFYAGWGLTDDRQPNPRRTRKLDLLELFAGAYLLYPQYFDLITHEPCSARKVISDIAVLRKKMDEWEQIKREKNQESADVQVLTGDDDSEELIVMDFENNEKHE